MSMGHRGRTRASGPFLPVFIPAFLCLTFPLTPLSASVMTLREVLLLSVTIQKILSHWFVLHEVNTVLDRPP